MNRFEPLPNMAMEVTPALEQRIRDLNREAHALHLGVFPTVFVDLEVEGLTKRSYKANSFTRNFWNYLAILLTGTTSATYGEGQLGIKRGTGAVVTQATTAALQSLAGSGNAPMTLMSATAGIVVGSGTVPESFDDYQLGAIIANGAAAGQLTWMTVMHSQTVEYDQENKVFKGVFIRFFANTGGEDLTVTESGLYVNATNDICIERTLFPAPVVVPSGHQLKVTYTFEFHFPEPEAGG